jgi:hypothetical protein
MTLPPPRPFKDHEEALSGSGGRFCAPAMFVREAAMQLSCRQVEAECISGHIKANAANYIAPWQRTLWKNDDSSNMQDMMRLCFGVKNKAGICHRE